MIIETVQPRRTPVPRDGWDRPLIVPRGGGKLTPYKRATNYVKGIEDPSGLTPWRDRTILRGAGAYLDDIRALSKMEEGKELNEAAGILKEKCFDMGGGNCASSRGTYLHGLTDVIDAGLELDPNLDIYDQVLMHQYRLLTGGWESVIIEGFTACESIQAAGTFDRLSRLPSGTCPKVGCDKLHITDLKTSKSKAYGKLTWAMQMALYSRSDLYDHTPLGLPDQRSVTKAEWAKIQRKVWSAQEAAACYIEWPEPVCQYWGFVTHLPQAGEETPAILAADLKKGWALVQFCEQLYRARKTKGLLTPIEKGAS